jgi:glycosyltransferase involved in cell wall biosynthesis
MSVWLLVAGDFTAHGGMDMANYALASYLARKASASGGSNHEVHVVSHRVASELSSLPTVRTHLVSRPLGAHRFGEPLMRIGAHRWQRRLADRGVRTVANGGNADTRDVNWVHYVHDAFRPDAAGLRNRALASSKHRRYLRQEQRALANARLIVCNSQRTADDVARVEGVDRGRTRVVYYGVDASRFGNVDALERESSRRALGLPLDRPLALFVGALGDRRKGFDVVFDAWRTLCARPDWDVDLVVAGTGAELPAWKARAAEQLPGDRMRFLGFRKDMPSIFAACDLLIHPARYEAYGLAVHEALCRERPAIVTASAGVAERYPIELHHLLLHDPGSAAELSSRLLSWRGDSELPSRVVAFASRLRSRSWDAMGQEIEEIVAATSPWPSVAPS